MPLIKISLMLFYFFSIPLLKAQSKNKTNDVLICYGNFPIKNATGYNYLIVEASHFSKDEVTTLKKTNKHVIAYISLGEVNQYAKHFKTIQPYVLSKNEIWDSYTLDLQNKHTQESLFNTIKSYVELGFTGLFLDNIDNYTVHGSTPQLKPELIAFLKRIKTTFPQLFLVQNAGLSILKDTNNYVDTVAIESIFTDYQFNTKTYKLRAKDDCKSRLKTIESLQKTTSIPFIFIEYSDTKILSKKIKRKLRCKQRKSSYFIGHINLQNLPN